MLCLCATCDRLGAAVSASCSSCLPLTERIWNTVARKLRHEPAPRAQPARAPLDYNIPRAHKAHHYSMLLDHFLMQTLTARLSVSHGHARALSALSRPPPGGVGRAHAARRQPQPACPCGIRKLFWSHLLVLPLFFALAHDSFNTRDLFTFTTRKNETDSSVFLLSCGGRKRRNKTG